MDKYDYREAVKDDVRDYIKNEKNIYRMVDDYRDYDEMREVLYNDLWVADSVTGNASGSYWFSTWKAEEALCHNLDLLGEALEEFGTQKTLDEALNDAEGLDVTIRCYLLGEALDEVLAELDITEDLWDKEDEDEDKEERERAYEVRKNGGAFVAFTLKGEEVGTLHYSNMTVEVASERMVDVALSPKAEAERFALAMRDIEADGFRTTWRG